MAAEDGPRLRPHSALRAFALYQAWRRPAIILDVPICAAARMATAVIVARCTVPELVRSVAAASKAPAMWNQRSQRRLQYAELGDFGRLRRSRLFTACWEGGAGEEGSESAASLEHRPSTTR